MTDQAPDPDRAAGNFVETAAFKRLARWLPSAMAGHFIIGVPALLISLVVAYGTHVQAGATQRMQQAAAWPFVAYGTANYTPDGQRLVSLFLTDNGLGPALIGPIEVRWRGRPMRAPVDLLAACCGYRAGRPMQLRISPVVNVALRPGEEILFMSLPGVAMNAGLADRFDAVRTELKVRACYCSIFDDCWIVEGPQSQPRKVAACPTDWAVRRER